MSSSSGNSSSGARDLAVSVRGLSKSYRIRHNAADAPTTLAEAIMRRLRHPLRGVQSPRTETFWALDGVNFDIRQGEVVGVIGRNGAGKSTLLKILSRITEPSRGRVELYGRVGSLLEVGTGFHQELTGRENIYLNGTILGMSRRDIARQFDAIVDFAGVEQFLDTPVKRYSSGMYVRLAFAVAAHLDSEIMVVDEVLAVGDAEFQRKCLGKMKDVATGGRTVLFVSHNMQSISLLCDTAMCLQRGRIAFHGEVQQAIQAYLHSFATTDVAVTDPDRRRGTGEYRIVSAAPASPVYRGDEEKVIEFAIERRRGALGQMFVQAFVVDAMGVSLAQCDSRLVGHRIGDADAIRGKLRLRTPWLRPGEYRIDLYIAGGGIVDAFEDACRLNISPVLPYPQTAPDDALDRCVVYSDFDWESSPTDETIPTPSSRARHELNVAVTPSVGTPGEGGGGGGPRDDGAQELASTPALPRRTGGGREAASASNGGWGGKHFVLGELAELTTRRITMLPRLARRPRIAYMGGGAGNLGDDAVFVAAGELLPYADLVRMAHPRQERRLARLGLSGRAYFDSVVLGGGTLINPIWVDSTRYVLERGLPVWAFGTGAGSWGLGQADDVPIDDWQPLLSRFRGIGVRGPRSQRRLAQIGLTHARVIGDLGLHFARERALPTTDPPTVLVNLIDFRPFLDPQRQPWRTVLAEGLRRLIRDGYRAVGVAMHAQDVWPTRELLRLAGVESPSVTTCATPTDFFAVAATCAFAMTVRLHAAVLSACAGVPSLILGYREKHLDFAESMDMLRWHVAIPDGGAAADDGNAELIGQRLLELSAESSSLRPVVLARAKEWRGRILDYAQEMAKDAAAAPGSATGRSAPRGPASSPTVDARGTC